MDLGLVFSEEVEPGSISVMIKMSYDVLTWPGRLYRLRY